MPKIDLLYISPQNGAVTVGRQLQKGKIGAASVAEVEQIQEVQRAANWAVGGEVQI